MVRNAVLHNTYRKGTDQKSETIFQIENTGAKLILVDPAFLDVVTEAADKVGFPHSRIFLFSDRECKEQRGVRDWRSLLGSPEEAEPWQWHRMTPEESRKRVAVLNYSSGYHQMLFDFRNLC